MTVLLYKKKLENFYKELQFKKPSDDSNLYLIMDFIYGSRGQFIKILRNYKNGFTVKELAQKSLFSPDEISKIENGSAFLPTPIFLEICKELNALNDAQTLYTVFKNILKIDRIDKNHFLLFEKQLPSNGLYFPKFETNKV